MQKQAETKSDGVKIPTIICLEKKKIWLSPIAKTHIPTENSKTNGQHKNTTKKLRLQKDCGPN